MYVPSFDSVSFFEIAFDLVLKLTISYRTSRFHYFVGVAQYSKARTRTPYYRALLQCLPMHSVLLLKKLLLFLSHCAKKKEVNSMSVENLALVFGLNILRCSSSLSLSFLSLILHIFLFPFSFSLFFSFFLAFSFSYSHHHRCSTLLSSRIVVEVLSFFLLSLWKAWHRELSLSFSTMYLINFSLPSILNFFHSPSFLFSLSLSFPSCFFLTFPSSSFSFPYHRGDSNSSVDLLQESTLTNETIAQLITSAEQLSERDTVLFIAVRHFFFFHFLYLLQILISHMASQIWKYNHEESFFGLMQIEVGTESIFEKCQNSRLLQGEAFLIWNPLSSRRRPSWRNRQARLYPAVIQ